MKKEFITRVEQAMLRALNNYQMDLLDQTLNKCLVDLELVKSEEKPDGFSFEFNNIEFIDKFISAKNVEGCSNQTLRYYRRTLENTLLQSELNVMEMTTDYLRDLLASYHSTSNCSNTTVDNVRRILSSFFCWLEEENFIIKSPMLRIHRIRTSITVKDTYSDENLELLRDSTNNLRDLAIIDLLSSTGMRVGELVKLNKDDIDFENKECIVFGKGNKERPVYFDARTKLHLQDYLNSRIDNCEALFVSLDKPYERLHISGVEVKLKKLGKRVGVDKVHPHKFRRTMATKAIDKGMPIEQVQNLLGHSQIDTTLRYALVNQNNIKISHKKYIG